jgi:Haem-binding domain
MGRAALFIITSRVLELIASESSEPCDKPLDINDVEWHLNNNMPLWYYLPLHPEAKLNEAQKADLLAGLRATYGDSGNSTMNMGAG